MHCTRLSAVSDTAPLPPWGEEIATATGERGPRLCRSFSSSRIRRFPFCRIGGSCGTSGKFLRTWPGHRTGFLIIGREQQNKSRWTCTIWDRSEKEPRAGNKTTTKKGLFNDDEGLPPEKLKHCLRCLGACRSSGRRPNFNYFFPRHPPPCKDVCRILAEIRPGCVTVARGTLKFGPFQSRSARSCDCAGLERIITYM